MSFVGKNIDKALDRTRMQTAAGRTVVALLARHANKHLESRPSQALLARRIGITARQVRTYLREAERLGEIEALEKGANRTTKYLVTILSDEVVDRKLTSTPNGQLDRKPTSVPDSGWTGSTASVDRKPTSYEVLEEFGAQNFDDSSRFEPGDSAEKNEGQDSTRFPSNFPDASTITEIDILGDHADEWDPFR